MHDEIRQRQQEAKEELRLIWRIVYRFNGGGREGVRLANSMCRAVLPDLCKQAFPYRELSRLGYEIMRDAADRDTDAYFGTLDRGEQPSFEVFQSPRLSYEHYELASWLWVGQNF
jgi:hypothetical protein